MDKEKLNAAISLICEKNELRPWMEAPRLIDGHFMATDSIIGLWGPPQGIEQPYNNAPKPPKVIQTFEGFKQSKINKKIILNDLKEQFSKIPLVDEFDESKITECPACNGEGEVEWEFERWTKYDECPNCYGYGEIGKKVKTGKQIPDPEAVLELFGAHFYFKLIERVINVCEALGLDSITCTFTNHSNNALVFDLGDSFQLVVIGNIKDSTKVITLKA